MLFFKNQNSINYQKRFFIKEVYYKIYKMLIIFLKWNKLLGKLIIKNKKSLYFHNTCVYSNKAKSISRKLKISRIIIREFANKSLYFGLHKHSW